MSLSRQLLAGEVASERYVNSLMFLTSLPDTHASGVPQGAMSLSAGGGGSVGGSVNPTTPTTTTTGRIEASQQLRDAEAYLGTLDADRADTCRELEDEAKLFLESPATPEQEKRFRLIYQLVRFHVRRVREGGKSVSPI